MKLNFLSLLILVIIVGASVGGAYGAGIVVGKGSPVTPAQAQNAVPGARTADSAAADAAGGLGASRAAGAAGRAVFGAVENIDGNTLTISAASGGNTQVTLSQDTAIEKTSEASRDELKPGVRVVVTGQQGTGGSMAASSIQIVPAGAGTGSRPAFDPSSRPTPAGDQPQRSRPQSAPSSAP